MTWCTCFWIKCYTYYFHFLVEVLNQATPSYEIYIYYYIILCSSKKFSSHKCSFYHWIQQVNFSLILLRPLPYFNSPFFQTKKSFQKVCKRRASTIMTSYFYSSYIKCTKIMVHIWICFIYIIISSKKVLYTSFVVFFVYKY